MDGRFLQWPLNKGTSARTVLSAWQLHQKESSIEPSQFHETRMHGILLLLLVLNWWPTPKWYKMEWCPGVAKASELQI